MDSVEIRGLSCRCIIGIRARERRVSQRVRLDIDLRVDLERAGKSGRIAHTIDYSRASTEIIALLQFRRYTLLEVAAEECAGWLFAAYPAVRGVSLSIAKPQALAGQAESGGVSIVRQRPAETTRQPTPFGFIEPQLETSEASICLVGLDPGATFTPASLSAEQALILPLSARLESTRVLTPHEPVLLRSIDSCTNRETNAARLVICAQRTSQL
jgi:7,8-dihydroneopterin aldolase/epimerase/oxygenase